MIPLVFDMISTAQVESFAAEGMNMKDYNHIPTDKSVDNMINQE
jgi:hypothetical protein